MTTSYEFRRRENRVIQTSLFVLVTNAYFVGSLPSTSHLNPWFRDNFQRSSTSLHKVSWDRPQLAVSQYAAKFAHHLRHRLHLRTNPSDASSGIRLRGGEDAIMDGVCSLTIPGDVDTMERALDIFSEKQVGSISIRTVTDQVFIVLRERMIFTTDSFLTIVAV